MSVIRSLILSIRANTSGLTAPLAKSQKSLAGFSAGVGKVTAALTGLTGGLTAVGAALAVTRQFSELDALAKGAKRIGATTEAFAGLKHAAELSDISVNELVGGVQRMQRTLSTGAAADVLKKLGLDRAALKQLPTEEIFSQIAGAIASIENPTERAGAAMEIFGRSGANMMPLLAEGAEGVRKLMAESKQLGTAFAGIDTAKIELANDNISRMKAAFSGLAAQLAVSVAPAIAEVADAITEVAKKFAQMRGGSVASDIDPSKVDLNAPGGRRARLDEILTNQARLRAEAQEKQDFLDRMEAKRSSAGMFDDPTLSGSTVIDLANAKAATGRVDQISAAVATLSAEAEKLIRQKKGIDAFFGRLGIDEKDVNTKLKAAGKGLANALDLRSVGRSIIESLVEKDPIARLRNKVLEQVEFHGMSPERAELEKLARKPGADPTVVAQAAAAIEQLDSLREKRDDFLLPMADAIDHAFEKAIEQTKALTAAADRWKDAIETPSEKFAREADEIAKLFQQGVLTEAQANRALDVAGEGLAPKEKTGEPRLSPALIKGTAAAVSAINRASLGAGADPMERGQKVQIDIARQQLMADRERAGLLRKIADAEEKQEKVAQF